MSSPDKHKPLSPEELLKMLEEHSGDKSSFSDEVMDDFEKEALEGFSAHTSPQKAKALMEEVNVSISKKAAGVEESTKKNRIIWFSAAASIAVIIIISSVFFKQTKEETSNIAMNEPTTQDMAPPVSPNVVTANPDDNTGVKEPAKEAGKAQAEGLLQELEIQNSLAAPAEKKAELSYSYNTTTASNGEGNGAIVSEVQKEQIVAAFGKADKDASKKDGYTSSDDNLKQANTTENSPMVMTDKVTTKSAYDETVVTREEIAANSKGKFEEKPADNKSVTLSNADVALYKMEDKEEKKVAEKMAKEKAKAEKSAVIAAGTTAPTATGMASSNAYYNGGELAIRDFVVNYVKTKNLSLVLKGHFKVIATVDANGSLKVDSVKNISNDCNDCIKPMTEALNTMKNWTPSNKNGRAVSSTTEFTLIF